MCKRVNAHRYYHITGHLSSHTFRYDQPYDQAFCAFRKERCAKEASSDVGRNGAPVGGELKLDKTALDIAKAYRFYRDLLLQPTQEKAKIYAKYGFEVVGSVISKDWEVLAAILLKDKAKAGYGSDLERHEVKSAVHGNSFEYQYHRNYGEQKLEEDKQVDHIFIAYTKNYLSIEIWRVEGHELESIFDSWLPGLKANYSGDRPKQRYRKTISFGTVKKKGELLVSIEKGALVEELPSSSA